MKPAVDDSSWLTEMIWPDDVAFWIGLVGARFNRQGFLVSLPYWQAAEKGLVHLSSHFGRIPFWDMDHMQSYGRCPSQWCHQMSSS